MLLLAAKMLILTPRRMLRATALALPFVYPVSDKGDYVSNNVYSACAAVRDILGACLNESTESDIASLTLFRQCEVRRCVQVLHCHGLLARSAGQWFLTTEKGRECLACCDALLAAWRLLDGKAKCCCGNDGTDVQKVRVKEKIKKVGLDRS